MTGLTAALDPAARQALIEHLQRFRGGDLDARPAAPSPTMIGMLAGVSGLPAAAPPSILAPPPVAAPAPRPQPVQPDPAERRRLALAEAMTRFRG